MLWYKAWLDTRWRFVIPLVVLVVNVWGLILEYPPVAGLLGSVQVHPDALVQSGALGRAILESIGAERTYRGYIWYQWFRNNLSQLAILFAVLLGSGNLLSGAAGTLFTLSLPRSRHAWLATRAVLGLGPSLTLALVPSVAVVLLSLYLARAGERSALRSLFSFCGDDSARPSRSINPCRPQSITTS